MALTHNDGTGSEHSRSAPRNIPFAALILLSAIVGVFFLELSLPIGAAGSYGRVSTQTLISLGSALRPLVIDDRQAFRLVTSIFLHAGWDHLLVNSIVLMSLGFLLEKQIGHAWFTGIFILSGLAGAVASLTFNPPNFSSVGASGAVMGLLCATFALTFQEPYSSERAVRQLRLLLFMIPGMIPAVLNQRPAGASVLVDYWAHIGGALLGGLLGVWLLFAALRGVRIPSGRQAMTGALICCLLLLPIGAKSGLETRYLLGATSTDSEAEAITLVSKTIDLKPDHAPLYFMRGYLRFALGQYQAAAVDLERSVRLDPSFGYDALLLYIVRARLGAVDKTVLTKYLEKSGKSTWPAPIFVSLR